MKNPSAAARGSLGRRGHAAAVEAWNAEVDALWRRRAFTPATAWPELWSVGDELERARLSAEFDRYRSTLTERFELESKVGPVQRSLVAIWRRGAA